MDVTEKEIFYLQGQITALSSIVTILTDAFIVDSQDERDAVIYALKTQLDAVLKVEANAQFSDGYTEVISKMLDTLGT